MKTKLIFAIAILLIFGSICVNARENNDGDIPSTQTDYSKQPFTIIAKESDINVLISTNSPDDYFEIGTSSDGINWHFMSVDYFTSSLKAGEKMCITIDEGYKEVKHFNISGGYFDVEGNIMSLGNLNYESATTIPSSNYFANLFSGNTNLISAENLVLPATTLAEGCYHDMFSGCTSLIKAPELPATTLAEECYKGMFSGCTSLTTAPQLPATTLSHFCYEFMFSGCTSLTTAPELPATGLWHRCYYFMFSDCTSLTTAPELPATNLAKKCYKGMFSGCTSLTTAPELPATKLRDYCYYAMFSDCTSLTTAPELPATDLPDYCYCLMFSGCTSLNYIKCLATDLNTYYATSNWTSGVSSTGTFVKNASATWPSGTSGIPSGWTVESYKPSTKRTIHVATAGTLPDLISEDEKYEIEELTLTGELNGTDFKFIREMAGVNDYYGHEYNDEYMGHDRTNGKLKSLDISKVNIVKGGSGYNFRKFPEPSDMIKIGKDYNGVAIPIFISDNSISDQLFSLTLLESIILPNNVVSIGDYAFSGCYALASVTIPNSVTSIGNSAFSSCSGLTSVTIPNSVISIGYSAFSGCSGLTSVTIPNSVTSIGDGAFESCSGLTSITIPNSVTSIGNSAFSGCSGLTSIKVESGNEKYDSRNNCNAIIETSSNTLVAGCKNTIIPNSVTSIGNSAFSGCSGLISISIPNSVISIGNSAFYSCSGLTSVTIPNSVTSIGGSAFSRCSGLTSVTIPNSVTSIGGSAFSRCSGLTSVTIPNSVTSIGNNAFSGCSGLTSITIPNSVTSIGSLAFFGTAWLNNQPDGLVYAGKVAYKYKGEMPDNASITIKDGTLGIACQAFSSCSGLTSITIPNSVISIGNYAFDSCSGLTSVTIPNSVTSIGNEAFSGCSGLTSVAIPNSVTSIGWGAFYNLNGLKKVLSKIRKPFKIDAFNRLPSDAELIVPIGTKSLYEAMDGWNKFSKITEHLPTLETQPAQPMSTTKARLIANVDEEDDDQHFGFEWLRYDAPESMPPYKVSAPLYDGCIVGSLSGLNPDKYYKYRPYYQSDLGETVFGEWITFNTGDANVFFEPEVHTKEATAVTNNSAQLSAVFVEGTDDIQEKGFEYWPKNSGARAVSLTRGNNVSTITVSGNNTSVTLEGLVAGVEYGYRSYVKTASGITYGEEKTFKTSLYGDVNGDNIVDNNDLNDLVSYIIGNSLIHFNKDAADLNNDNQINAADVVKMVNILK